MSAGALSWDTPSEPPCRRPCFGEDESVVMVVPAVVGRCPDPFVCVVVKEVGSLPVSSRLLSRDFRVSSSSQTVEGAVVEAVDSVPPARDARLAGPAVEYPFSGDELY